MSAADVIYGSVVDSLPDLSGRCFAITGTTSGTGLWTAITALRKSAACVMLLNRPSSRVDAAMEKLKAEGRHGEVVAVACDLQSFASVREAATQVQAIAAKFGGLDGLVNNAGVLGNDERTVDGLDVQMQTNHLSHFLLTRLLMPSLEAAAAARGEARVVQHSSGMRAKLMGIIKGDGNLEAKFFRATEAGSLGGNRATMSRYHQTKLANSVFAMALHRKLLAAGSKVKSLCAEPGVAQTSFGTTRSTGTAPASTPMPAFEFQSAADGACSLIVASFGAAANSGDMYMPGTVVRNDTGVPMVHGGMPVKCITAGAPTPTTEFMAKMFKREELTMREVNHELLWAESEAATGEFHVGRSGGLSKL